MATTPVMGLPYPVGTDRVMDGDNAMQALAERIESRYPRGVLSHTVTSTTMGIDTVHRNAVVANVSVSAGRKIRVTGGLLINALPAATNVFIALSVDSTEIANMPVYVAGPNYIPLGPLVLMRDGVLTAGVHNFAVLAWTGAGTATVNAGPPNYLTVEDCGYASGT